MRKLFTTCISRLTKTLAITAMTIAAGVSAHTAAAEDLGALELGETYTLPAYKEVSATFTAPKDGTVLMEGERMNVYADAAHTSDIQTTYHGYTSLGQGYTFTATANTTYYLNLGFSMGGKFRLSMETELEIQSVSPAEGSTYSSSGDGSCVIVFNSPVTVGGATLSTGNTSAKVSPAASGNTVQTDISARVKAWLNNGTLKKGDQLTLKLTDVKAITDGKLYNGDGIVTVNYISAGKATQLTAQNVPATFKSYYVPGDPEGMLTLTFDRDLQQEGAYANISTGNVEGETGEYYFETLPVTVSGATATVDLTGKSRRTADMLTTGITPEAINVQLYQIKDAEGNYVESMYAGMIGSFAFSLPYQELQRVEVLGAFTPANGESLAGVDNLTVWISGLSAIEFSGFRFDYADGNEMKTATVALEACSYVPENDNEGTYTVAIPAEVKGKSNITVTLADLVSKDGIDHSKDVKAVYDTFVITWSNPAEGAEFEVLADGTEITVETNYSDRYPEMYMEYEIIDLNPVNPQQAILKSYSWLVRDEYGAYTSTVYGSYKMIRGHEYSVVFTAWETEAAKQQGEPAIGTASMSWYGLSEPFQASDVQLSEITPAEGTLLQPTDTEFVLLFDGMVNIKDSDAQILLGSGMSMPFDELTATDPEYLEDSPLAYSSRWTLKAPASYMATLSSSFMFSIKAYDMDGRLIVNPDEEYPDETSFLLFNFETANTYRDFAVTPADNEEVESLSEITVYAEVGIMPSYNVPVEQIVVMDRFGGTVAHVDNVTLVENQNDPYALNTTLTLTLNQEVTEAGGYRIYFPEGVFILGTETSQWTSMEKVSDFFVADNGSGEVPAYTTDPAEGQVSSLEKITVLFDVDTDVMRNWDPDAKITLVIDGGEAIEITDADTTSDDPSNWDVPFDRLVINLPQTYTAEGTYVITIDANYLNVGGDNITSPIVLTYTIGTGSLESVAADQNGRMEVYNISGVHVATAESVEELNSLPAGIYIVNGVKVAVK